MGQSISGGALAGGSAGMSNDIVELLEDLRDIGRRNEENTSIVDILGMQFV